MDVFFILTNFVFPFILYFAITYSLLKKLKIFEENINRVVAFSLSFLATYYTYTYLNQAISFLGYLIFAVIVSIFVFLILYKSYEKVKREYEKTKRT